MTEPVVNVEHVSKKFCRSLKRSLWYGVQDVGAELVGGRKNGRLGNEQLRPDEFWAVRNLYFPLSWT